MGYISPEQITKVREIDLYCSFIITTAISSPSVKLSSER